MTTDAARDAITLNVEVDGHGCWNWLGPFSSYGYGQSLKPKMLAHRLSYQTFIGTLVSGLVIDHLCENKVCVNPGHLEQVTSRENVLRWHKARRAREKAFAS